jgi:transcriptional regulator with XRE-family HTH domain
MCWDATHISVVVYRERRKRGLMPQAAEKRKRAKAQPPPLPLGGVLRRLRTARELTLEDVANGTGLSVSFLSLLENNKSDISIGRLRDIAQFYDLNLSDLFSEKSEPPSRIVHWENAREVKAKLGDGIQIFLLSDDPMRSIDPFRIVMEPGAKFSEWMSHDGSEFLHVISGQLVVMLGDSETHHLVQGDTIYYLSSISHLFENPGRVPTVLVGAATHRPVHGL